MEILVESLVVVLSSIGLIYFGILIGRDYGTFEYFFTKVLEAFKGGSCSHPLCENGIIWDAELDTWFVCPKCGGG